jgi:hypothetical protein
VWSIPSALLALRCLAPLHPRSVSAASFDAWALLRPTVRPTTTPHPTMFRRFPLLIPRHMQPLLCLSFAAACSSVTWVMSGPQHCHRPTLIAGFLDGAARAFRLLSDLSEAGAAADSDKSSSGVSTFALPDTTHFLQVATFVNPSRHEAVAFVAGRAATDGSAAALLLGCMGGRSVFSTAMSCMNDLQSCHHRGLPQEVLYPSAMLWPNLGRTILVSDCESSSVDEIDALTGDCASQQLLQPAVTPALTGHPRRSVFVLPDQCWPTDIAHCDTDFFAAKDARAALVVAGSDGGVYIAPLTVRAKRPLATPLYRHQHTS